MCILLFCPPRVDSTVSFCKRSRNASIPSDRSDVDGNGGGLVRLPPDLGEADIPALRFEYAELREVSEVKDVRCCRILAKLRVLLCVPVRLCPCGDASAEMGVDALAVLGLRSNGPGAIVSSLFEMFSPAFVRGLNGANNGLGAA